MKGVIDPSRGRWCSTRSLEARGLTPSPPSSERVPRRVRREADVADVGAEPQADAGADRRHDDAAVGDERGADAADEIGRAVDAGEARVELLGRFQPVDQEQRLGAVGADVGAERGPVPVDLLRAAGAHVERALAVAHAGEERAAALGAQDVAGGAAAAS